MPFTLSSADPALATAALVLAKSTLLLGVAALGALMLRRASAAARHLLWCVAVLALLAMPALTLAVPSWEPAFLAVIPQRAAPAAGPAAHPGARLVSTAEPALPASPEGGKPAPLGTLLLAVWAAGAAAVLARLALGMAGARKLARSAAPLDDAEWTELARRLGRAAGVRRPVRLLASGRAQMPVTWGVLRPFILLPAEAVDWDAEKRRVVLLHELAHVARRDCLTQALATVCCAVYWFHPGAWAAARRMRVEREQACDDRVLDAGARASEYAGHLIEVARAFRAPRLASALAMARPSHLEDRVLAVLDERRDRRAVTLRAGAACAATALLALLPLAALVPSQLRSAARPAEVKKVALVVPFRSQADAQGVARGRATVNTRVDDLDIRLDVDFHVQVAQQAASQPPARGGSWRRTGPAQMQLRQAAMTEYDYGDLAPVAVASLIRASRDQASTVRREAVRALGGIEDKSVVAPLIESLSDDDPGVRSEAVRALGTLAARMSDGADVEVGARPLSEEACLRNKMAPSPAQGLRVAARHGDPRVRDAARRVLGQMGGLADAGAQKEAPLRGGGVPVDLDYSAQVSRWTPRQ
jgi:beta-lactamase regulating signal transducer with metallopeptidase domain